MNTIPVELKTEQPHVYTGVYQHDYGQILQIHGKNLPAVAEVQFSLQDQGGQTETRVGVTTNDVLEVQVPDKMLKNERVTENYCIFAYLYITDGKSGNTEYKITIHVISRPAPGKISEDSDESHILDEAVNAVNAAADRAEQAEQNAKASAIEAGKYAASAYESATAAEKKKREAIEAIQEQEETSVGKITTHTDDEIQRILNQTAEPKRELEQTITNADASKRELDHSIETAGTSKTALDKSVGLAGTAKTELDTSIRKAGEAKTALDGSAKTAGEMQETLSATVKQAGTLDTSLGEKIETGTQLKTDLTVSGEKAVQDIQTAGSEQLGKMQAVAEEFTADREQIATNKEDIGSLKEDLGNVEKITSTNFAYEISVGGFNSNTMEFNDDSNYIHSKYPIPISDDNFVIRTDGKAINDLRFSVFYDKNLKITDYSSRSIPPEKVETYPYINIVLPSTYRNKQIEVICDDTRGRIEKKIDSVNDRLKEDTDYSLITGGFDATTGEFNADTNYLHSNDFIPIKNNILSVIDPSLQSLTQIRFIVYYDSLKRYKTYSEFKIDQEKVNQYSYAKIVLYKDNIDEGLCISGDSDVEGDVQERISGAIKDISVLNTISDICNYRYIMTSFGESGKKGLFILGSNDLKHFNLLNGYNPFIPKENVGVRDPSIAFIDGWYYIVYTIAVGVNVTNQIGLVRTKNFVEWDELPNLTIVSDEYDFSNGYCWAPCFFRDGDNWYIVSGCCTDSNNQEFLHRIMLFDVDTKTIGKAFTTNIPFIDGHIYKENGIYYCLTSQGKLYKSQSLLSTEYVLVPDNGLNFSSYEGQYAIRKDDGTYRVFGQKVLNESVGNTDAFIYYQDGGASLESNFGERKQISYDSDTLKYVSKRWSNKNGIFWHATIYDRYCFRDNNNNY